MAKLKSSELDTGETLRCGRCAGILPDETSNYCHSCGAVFSEFHPTTSFCTFEAQKQKTLAFKRNLHLAFAISFSLIFGLFVLLSSHELYRRSSVAAVQVERPLRFWINQDENYPMLEEHVVNNGIFVGLQSFKDHFDYDIEHWEVFNKKWPEAFSDLVKHHPEESKNSFFWKTAVDQYFLPEWSKNPYAPLNIIVTNKPIVADKSSDSLIETAHLGKNRLVSGLGHPSIVIVSLHRLIAEYKDLSDKDKAKFLGEYIVAHEMGHALFGLKDFVEYGEENYSKQLRGPASASDNSYCVMHTDAGGGSKAWNKAQKRELGQPSPCTSYNAVVELHKLRNLSIENLKLGNVKEGKLQMEKALEGLRLQAAEGNINPIFSHVWSRELKLFSSLFY